MTCALAVAALMDCVAVFLAIALSIGYLSSHVDPVFSVCRRIVLNVVYVFYPELSHTVHSVVFLGTLASF